jgi:hypothetical protein
MENRRFFFETVADILNIDDEEGWYGVTVDQIERLGGAGLLAEHYCNSLVFALMEIYPTIQWNVWRFDKVPQANYHCNFCIICNINDYNFVVLLGQSHSPQAFFRLDVRKYELS